MIITGETRKN